MGKPNGNTAQNKVFHPNSRKAGQVIKRLAHARRVQTTQKARTLKEKILIEKIVWFQTEIEERTRPVCPHDLDELIERFLIRQEEEIDRLESALDIGRRRNANSTAKSDEIQRGIDDQKLHYTTSGIELPDVSCLKGLTAVKGWGSDVIDLVKIPVKKFNKKQLTSFAIGNFCDDCSARRKADQMDVMTEEK
ncbi:hypothetical protein BV898_17480 [Hypsibius exemplaris]|uniref:Translation machinery-associated protein 16 n=1 Tax=Hypsibius exemplaris TaxID=2072580 RepID=A0A9X6RM74_HYPEX|nr:hypothetical protein BV898_17480 [Hypsibius exemplaris]